MRNKSFIGLLLLPEKRPVLQVFFFNPFLVVGKGNPIEQDLFNH